MHFLVSYNLFFQHLQFFFVHRFEVKEKTRGQIFVLDDKHFNSTLQSVSKYSNTNVRLMTSIRLEQSKTVSYDVMLYDTAIGITVHNLPSKSIKWFRLQLMGVI